MLAKQRPNQTGARASIAGDGELLHRLAGGNEDALVSLMDRHGKRVHSFCYLMLGESGAAAEATHEVFVAAWQGAARFEGRSSVSTWLLRIAVRRCQDRRRGFARLRRLLERLAGFSGTDGPPPGSAGLVTPRRGPANRLESSEFASEIERALATVPAAFRESLLLRAREEMSYEEIAAATGTGVGTVKSRIRRARRALSAALQRP